MDIDKLTDDQAVRAVQFLAERWSEKEGAVVVVALQQVHSTANKQSVALPGWATAGTKVNKASGKICRNVLEAIVAGDDKRAREWARGAIASATQPRGQVFDPVTAGALLIALVLAARIKRLKIGNFEIDFYEGVPKETVEIVEKAAGVITPKP